MTLFSDIGFDNTQNFRGTSISSSLVPNEGIATDDYFKKMLQDIVKKTTESTQEIDQFSFLNSSEDEEDGSSNFTKYLDAQYAKQQVAASFSSSQQNLSSLQQLIVKFFNFDGQVLSQAGINSVDVEFLKYKRVKLQSKAEQDKVVKEYESISLAFLNLVHQTSDKDAFKKTQNYKAIQYVITSIYERFTMFDLPEKVTALSEKVNEIDASLLDSSSNLPPGEEHA